jgi:hypothetical protein
VTGLRLLLLLGLLVLGTWTALAAVVVGARAALLQLLGELRELFLVLRSRLDGRDQILIAQAD